MPWVKLDDRFPDHPKTLSLGDDYDSCVTLHIRGLCYCAANLTDGFIPSRVFRGYERECARLVEVGLWDEAEGGFEIHDYLDYNPSRDDALASRKSHSERGRKGAQKRWNRGPRMATAIATAIAEPIAGECPVPVPLTRSRSKDKPLSKSKVDEALLGYWCNKANREPASEDIHSLRTLEKKFGPDIVKVAIGQACVQGAAPDNYGLITTIAKGESA